MLKENSKYCSNFLGLDMKLPFDLWLKYMSRMFDFLLIHWGSSSIFWDFQMGQKVSQPNTPVWCHNDWAAIFDYTVDTGPQEASGLWIHSSGRLILNIDRKHSVNNKTLS